MDYENNRTQGNVDLDKEFENFAKEIEQELLSGGKTPQRVKQVGEDIKYSGLVKGEMKIIRVLGGVPLRDDALISKDPYTARVVRIANIRNDNGRFVRVVIPSRELEPEHIYYKIINKVFEIDFDETKKRKKKVYRIEKIAPEIFDLITKNGIPPTSNKIYGLEGKGWLGRDYLLMNCIDRNPSVYKWSKENKHTVVLSKSVNTFTIPSSDTNAEPVTLIYAEPGVPSYSFLTILSTGIFKYYGNWNKYDIGVEKTGLMQPAFRIINASKHKEEVPKHMQPYVVDGPLTEEELSWEKYNFAEIFKPVTEEFFFSNFKNTIKRIDLALGTSFFEYLSEKALSFDTLKEEDEKPKNAPTISTSFTNPTVVGSKKSSLSSKELDTIFGNNDFIF